MLIAIAGLVGSNKSLASSSEKPEFDDCSNCADITFNEESKVDTFDKTYVYTDKSLADGAVSFLKEQNIPYSIKYFKNERTTISIKNKHDIILATQRWGALSIPE